MKSHVQAEVEHFSPFDGTNDSVIDFLRRRLPMTLAINTVIALLIALLLHSWDEVIPNLVIAYCIGLSILALVAAVRCTVMQSARRSPQNPTSHHVPDAPILHTRLGRRPRPFTASDRLASLRAIVFLTMQVDPSASTRPAARNGRAA